MRFFLFKLTLPSVVHLALVCLILLPAILI